MPNRAAFEHPETGRVPGRVYRKVMQMSLAEAGLFAGPKASEAIRAAVRAQVPVEEWTRQCYLAAQEAARSLGLTDGPDETDGESGEGEGDGPVQEDA